MSKTLDFKQWAVVAHKDDTGLGRQARDIRKVLSLGRHIVIPTERLTDHRFRHPGLLSHGYEFG